MNFTIITTNGREKEKADESDRIPKEGGTG